MQNSTQWFNLNSNESKFSINIYRSTTKWLLIVSCILLLLSVLLTLYFFEYDPALVLSIFISLIILLCFGVGIKAIKQSNYDFNTNSRIPFISLELTIQGQVLFPSGDKYYIHPSSRSGLLGCWFVLVPDDEKESLRKSLFIFKDSVSPKNYARLCRTITRNNIKVTEGSIY